MRLIMLVNAFLAQWENIRLRDLRSVFLALQERTLLKAVYIAQPVQLENIILALLALIVLWALSQTRSQLAARLVLQENMRPAALPPAKPVQRELIQKKELGSVPPLVQQDIFKTLRNVHVWRVSRVRGRVQVVLNAFFVQQELSQM